MPTRISASPYKYYKRLSFVLFSLLCLVWISIYTVIITGAFSRAFYASISAYDTMTSNSIFKVQDLK